MSRFPESLFFYHIIKYSLTVNSTQQYCHVILIFFHKMANKRNVLKIISLCRLAMNLDIIPFQIDVYYLKKVNFTQDQKNATEHSRRNTAIFGMLVSATSDLIIFIFGFLLIHKLRFLIQFIKLDRFLRHVQTCSKHSTILKYLRSQP